MLIASDRPFGAPHPSSLAPRAPWGLGEAAACSRLLPNASMLA